MHRLTPLILTGALAVPAAATSAVEWETPRELRGHWVTGGASCNSASSGQHLRITEDRFLFGSQSSRPYGLRRSGSSGHNIDLVSTAGGRQRTTSTMFTLSQRGQQMTAVMTVENRRRLAARPVIYRRCR